MMTIPSTSIQLALFSSENHLTVKILQVKNLQSSNSEIFVKITLIPDREPLECQTRSIRSEDGHGQFNEQFTFEINQDDRKKRLCFSLNERRKKSDRWTSQGCFSFGIRNTVEKQRISGWFYFLPEDIGEFRHQRCSEKSISRIHRGIAHLEEHQFLIPRQSNGSFGFTIVGDSPCSVGEVTPFSSADRQGLRPGDFLVKINGLNVSRAQQRTIYQLIKGSKASVKLTIHRCSSRCYFSFYSKDLS